MKFNLLILSLNLLAIACGGGGGSSSSSSNSVSSFKVSDVDINSFVGVWYSDSFTLDGTQVVPDFAREIRFIFNSDGTWSTSLTLDENGSINTYVATSENSSSSDLTIQSFSYIIESENRVSITETYSDSTGTHTVSTSIIKQGVDDEIVGTYDVDISTYRADGVNLLVDQGYTANYVTVSSDGTFVSTLVDDSGEESSTINTVIRKGVNANIFYIYLISGSYESLVGTVTKADNLVSVDVTYYDGLEVTYNATKRD